MSHKLQDTVHWTSQSQGFKKTKSGVVVEIVPPKTYPNKNRFPQLYKGGSIGSRRNHESYVVMVGNQPYWPRVTHLKPGKGLFADAGPSILLAAIEAAKRICPQQAHLVPHHISELKIINLAMETAFIDEITGPDVDLIREAKKLLRTKEL